MLALECFPYHCAEIACGKQLGSALLDDSPHELRTCANMAFGIRLSVGTARDLETLRRRAKMTSLPHNRMVHHDMMQFDRDRQLRLIALSSCWVGGVCKPPSSSNYHQQTS